MHNMPNLKVNVVQQQKIAQGSSCVSQEQKLEATVATGRVVRKEKKKEKSIT